MHPAALPLESLQAQCDIQRTRGSGPGGQHRNKVETAIVITHRPSGIRAEASERRSQAQNLAMAWQRLRTALAVGVRDPVAADEPRSPLWTSRIRGGKIRVSPDHEDFGPLLAELLDRLHAAEAEMATVAEQMQTSSSQIVKFLKLHPPALAKLNDWRRERGLRALV